MNRFRIIIGLFLGIATISLKSQPLPATYFIPDQKENSETGYIQLKWRADHHENEILPYRYQLEQGEDSLFSRGREIYQGNDLASFISGLPDGKFYFRVRTVDHPKRNYGPWSSIKVVEVKHHSLRLALSLFTLGGIVFLSTVVIVVQGSRQTGGDQ